MDGYRAPKRVEDEVVKFNLVNPHLGNYSAFHHNLYHNMLVMPLCVPMSKEEILNKKDEIMQFFINLKERNIAYIDVRQAHCTLFHNQFTLIDTCRVFNNANTLHTEQMMKEMRALLDIRN